MKVQIKLHKDAKIPERQTQGSSGYDLHCNLEDNGLILNPGRVEAIPTGLFLKIEEGYEAQVRSRSGLALNKKVSVLNSPGTIDSDYTGEVKVLLFNHSKHPVLISHGDRIAQLVFQKVETPKFIEVEELVETSRGSKGFGSTGK